MLYLLKGIEMENKKDKKINLCVSITKEAYEILKQRALQENRNVSNLIDTLIKDSKKSPF